MRVLITGAAGMLGSELLSCAPADAVVAAVTRGEVPSSSRASTTWYHAELTDRDATMSTVVAAEPDVVIHTAYCQDSRSDIVDATDSIADAAASVGAAMIHLSTDAVFDGEHAPFAEHDEPAPVLDYGRWKLDAERALLAHVPDAAIVRPSLIVRLDPPDRATAGVLDAVADGPAGGYRFFVDEMRTPIRVEDLAVELWALVALPRADRGGIWHVPGAEVMSRLELAQRIARHHRVDPTRLTSASVADHPSPRARDLTTTSARRHRLQHPPQPI